MSASRANAPIVIGVCAGEASGDALGAELIAAVKAMHPDVRFVGIGGPRMQSAGCTVWYPMSRLALRGYVEVLSHLPGLVRLRRDFYKRLRAERVPLFIGIDAPDFTLGLEARLKRAGVRTVHYVSPSVWAWRKERVHTIAASAHRLLTLFPFEPPLYRDAPLSVTFVGHPLAAEAATAESRREARELLQLHGAGPMFALLPGSRMSELAMHSEVLLKAAAAMLRAHPEARFLVPLVSRETREHFERTQYQLGLEMLPLILLYGHAGDALRAADVAVVASGTATLEAALARCPHLVFYRVNRLTGWLVTRKLLLPWVSLPNVVARRFIVAEFLQRDASSENLSRAALNLYEDTVTRERLELLFAAMADSLRAQSSVVAAQAISDELRAAGVSCG